MLAGAVLLVSVNMPETYQREIPRRRARYQGSTRAEIVAAQPPAESGVSCTYSLEYSIYLRHKLIIIENFSHSDDKMHRHRASGYVRHRACRLLYYVDHGLHFHDYVPMVHFCSGSTRNAAAEWARLLNRQGRVSISDRHHW